PWSIGNRRPGNRKKDECNECKNCTTSTVRVQGSGSESARIADRARLDGFDGGIATRCPATDRPHCAYGGFIRFLQRLHDRAGRLVRKYFYGAGHRLDYDGIAAPTHAKPSATPDSAAFFRFRHVARRPAAR